MIVCFYIDLKDTDPEVLKAGILKIPGVNGVYDATEADYLCSKEFTTLEEIEAFLEDK